MSPAVSAPHGMAMAACQSGASRPASQASDSCSRGQELGQHRGRVLFVVATLRHPAAGIDPRPGLVRMVEDVVQVPAEILDLLVDQVVDHLQDRPIVGAGPPARLLVRDALHQRADGLGLVGQLPGDAVKVHG